MTSFIRAKDTITSSNTGTLPPIVNASHSSTYGQSVTYLPTSPVFPPCGTTANLKEERIYMQPQFPSPICTDSLAIGTVRHDLTDLCSGAWSHNQLTLTSAKTMCYLAGLSRELFLPKDLQPIHIIWFHIIGRAQDMVTSNNIAKFFHI